MIARKFHFWELSKTTIPASSRFLRRWRSRWCGSELRGSRVEAAQPNP